MEDCNIYKINVLVGGQIDGGGVCVNIIGSSGDVTITALSSGDVKITGRKTS